MDRNITFNLLKLKYNQNEVKHDKILKIYYGKYCNLIPCVAPRMYIVRSSKLAPTMRLMVTRPHGDVSKSQRALNRR